MNKHIFGAARLSVAASLLSLSLQAAPVIIDDFSSGDGVTTTNTTQDGTMVGGERDIVFGPTGATVTVGGGSLSITSVTNPGTISFTYDGDDNAATGNGLGLAGLDLSMSGSNTGFEIVVSQITGSFSYGMTLYETLGDTSFGSDFLTLGTNFISFADFTDANAGAVFSSVEQIRLNLSMFSDTSSITIDSIRALGDVTSDVPEPGTWLLMLTGIGALATMRSRQS